MGTQVLTDVLRYIRCLAWEREDDEQSDARLLQQFIAQRDQSAFAAILQRHAALVFGTCCQVLCDVHDAEDAFQATFLVLASKATSIRKHESLAAWLHRVAFNISRTAKTGTAQRRAHERQAIVMAQASSVDEVALGDWQPLIHEEVDQLPEKYRVPVVLCYLEGKTHDEAARQLGWPLGTVKGRLARARDLLRTRLARRGLALTSAGLGTALAESATAAVVPPALLGLTLRAAVSFAAGGSVAGAAASAKALALAKGALPTLTATKLVSMLVLLLAIGAMGVAAVVGPGLWQETKPESRAGDEEQVPSPSGPLQQADAGPKDADAHGDPLPPAALARLGTVRLRHAGEVTTVVHFPDGKTVASGGPDGTIRLWDAATGKEVRRFPGDHVTLSPDGKTWASWTAWDTEKKIYLWEVATGNQLREFKRLGGAYAVAFSPDGKVLAAGGVNGDKLNQLSLWEVATGKELPAPQMGGKYDYVHHLAFSPDGKLLATAGETDGSVRLWELATGNEIRRFRALKGGGTEVLSPFAFSPDGKTFVSAAKWLDSGKVDRTIRLWEVDSGKEIRQFTSPRVGGCSAVLLSPDGQFLYSGHDGVVGVWEAATGKLLRTLEGHQETVKCLSLSPDGKTLASGSRDRTLRLWDLATGKSIHPFPGHQGEVTSVALSPDGKTVISASEDRTIRLWELATGKEIRRLDDQKPVRSIAVAPNGKLMASRSWSVFADGSMLRLWDLASGKELKQFPELKHASHGLAFAPDGRSLAVGGYRAVHRLDVATAKEVVKAVPSKEEPGSGDTAFIAFSPDGKMFAWSNYSYCRLSETATGKELHSFAFFRGPDSLASISWGAFSADGQTLLLQTEGAFCVWDVARRKELRRFGGERRHAFSAALSPDGKTLAAGGGDGVIRLWEVATGKERRQFHGHQGSYAGGVVALAWSADGKVLVSGGADTSVLVWNVGSVGNKARGEPINLAAPELEALWTDLLGDDAVKAYQSACALRAAPNQSVPFLRKSLPPVAEADSKHLARLIADLDHAKFDVRMKATQELEDLEKLAEPALRQALAGKPSLEAQRRMEQALDKLDRFLLSGQPLRSWRAIEVLEHIGTPEARQVLEKLAQGTAESRLTQAARAAHGRLTKGPANDH